MLVDLLIAVVIAGVVGFCAGMFIGGSGKEYLMRERVEMITEMDHILKQKRELEQMLIGKESKAA
jgi:hypothetical protein